MVYQPTYLGGPILYGLIIIFSIQVAILVGEKSSVFRHCRFDLALVVLMAACLQFLPAE